jgi:hypothetical protein
VTSLSGVYNKNSHIHCYGISPERRPISDLLLDGTLDESIQEFWSKPAAGHILTRSILRRSHLSNRSDERRTL